MASLLDGKDNIEIRMCSPYLESFKSKGVIYMP